MPYLILSKRTGTGTSTLDASISSLLHLDSATPTDNGNAPATWTKGSSLSTTGAGFFSGGYTYSGTTNTTGKVTTSGAAAPTASGIVKFEFRYFFASSDSNGPFGIKFGSIANADDLNTGQANTWSFRHLSNGFDIYDNVTNFNVIPASSMVINTWYTVGFEVNMTTRAATGYLNGIKKSTVTVSTSKPTAGIVGIGLLTGAGGATNWKMDEFAYWNNGTTWGTSYTPSVNPYAVA